MRAILVGLVLACLLPGVIGAAALFAHEYGEGRAQMEKDTLQTARALAQTVDGYLVKALAIAQTLATDVSLATGDFALFHARAGAALEQVGPGFGVVLADEDGQQILHTRQPFGAQLPRHGNPAQVRAVFETGEPAISDLFVGGVLQRPVMSIDVPVVREGEVAYVLSVGILPEHFNVILRAQSLPPEWVAAIFDSAGTIVARTHAPERFVGKKGGAELIRRIRESPEGSVELTTHERIAVLAVYSRSPATGWSVGIGIPKQALEAQLAHTLSLLAAGVAILFAVGLGLAWLMGERIARSFRALIAPAVALGKGEAVRVAPTEVKEANEVAGAMRKAADLLSERTAKLHESNEELRKFKFFSDHANDEHVLLDQAGRIRYANRLACERLGYDEAELLRMSLSDIDPVYPQEWFREVFVRGKQVAMPPFEGVHRRKDGSTFPVEITATVLELKGEWLMFATSRDITERKLAEARVRDAALHDSLTGLPNRALVFEFCERLLAGARRGHGGGALLFIDLDRFKPINDLYGHEIGDRVLQEVGRRLVECTRDEDLVGRLGGDEFVVVLSHLGRERERATIVAQHVLERIGVPFRIDALELSISPSIGISLFPEHAADVSALIHTADVAMYQAKQSGRANYQSYTPELDERAEEANSLEARLKSALHHDGLRLHYQPIIDIESGALVGAEALLRLADAEAEAEAGAGCIGPERFIPIAESAGLIERLGEWVAAEACRQHEAWLREGLRVAIAINVSPLQFRQRAFAQRLGKIVADSGIDPEGLQIEVTESAVMESVEVAVAILEEIKSFGIRVALDDFGTGYSSLSSLSSLPLDKLKVDQSFVRRIERDAKSQAITRAVIALGRALDLEIVGEGIESEETLRYLRREGCDQAQGFWFSHPLPAAQFARWCRERAGR